MHSYSLSVHWTGVNFTRMCIFQDTVDACGSADDTEEYIVIDQGDVSSTGGNLS